ncbi:hypothetical protein RR42_m0184 [Cupriavidus basilensis]|uniref:Uncharacterized protein n=1 Tax=Cupriavidus basilensis TaxID=68895 RepID=A0A0C4Y679_9BURK|nr:hypothetical protein RR42_m0184 [Cupriavidus basilensis]
MLTARWPAQAGEAWRGGTCVRVGESHGRELSGELANSAEFTR